MNALTSSQILAILETKLSHWQYLPTPNVIRREIRCKNFYETMAIVNAVAWIAHQHNHHPDLEVGYNYCHINYATHDAKGVTTKDIDCAQAINQLIDTNAHTC